MYFSLNVIYSGTNFIRSLFCNTLCLCIYLLAHTAGAQDRTEYVFQHLTVENGLISPNVPSVLQDRLGYLWVGVEGGLQRYDGEDFLTYRYVPDDTTGLTPGGLKGLYEDQYGEIWGYGFENIVVVFNPSTQAFRRIRLKDGLLKGTYFFESGQRFYVISDKGIVRMNPERTNVEAITVPPAVASPVPGATFDSEGRLWSWGKTGFYCYDPANGQVFNQQHNPYGWELLYLMPQPVRAAYFDTRDNLWFSTWDDWKTYRFSLKENKVKVYQNPEEISFAISQMMEDAGGNLWAFSSDKPPCYYLPGRDTFICLNNDSDHEQYRFIGDAGYADVIRDREGNIWIATDRGLNIFNPSRQTTLSKSFNNTNYRDKDWMRDVFQARNGDIYLIYWSQYIVVLDRHLEIKRVISNTQLKEHYLLPILYLHSFSATEDNLGRIWIGHSQGGISLIDTSSGRLKSILCTACQGQTLINLTRLRNGNILIGLNEAPGIVRWNWRDGSFRYFEIPEMKNKPGADITRKIVEDSQGNIWVGTLGKGLYKLDSTLMHVTGVYYFNAPGETEALHNEIYTIAEIDPNNFLIGTYLGLKWLSLSNNTYLQHPLNKKLGRGVHAIKRDHNGNFWLATGNGLFCIPADFSRLIFIDGTREGMLDPVFSAAFATLEDGRMIAGTFHGNYTVFDPDALLRSGIQIFRPILASVSNLENILLWNSYGNEKLTLPHNQNNLRIAYASLTYGTSGITYQYRMDGLSTDWVEAGTQHSVNFNFLPPGHYTFHVRAIGPDGQVTESTVLPIIIQPPWWTTWWFILLVSAIASFWGYIIIRTRIRRFRERATVEKRIADLQNQALRAQINPHFIFNALQSVKKFVLLNDVDQAERYLSRFAQLIRQIMDNSRESAVSLRREMDLLNNYLLLEQLRFGNNFDYRFEVSESISPDEFEMPSMMLQPFAENAVLHGLAYLRNRRGLLIIRCSEQNDSLLIEIEDNGVGRARAEMLKSSLQRQHHRSAGMDITTKRLALFDEKAHFQIHDLTDKEGNGCGTRVEIWLPLD